MSVLYRKDLMEQMRSKKVMILAIIFLFLALASPITAKLMPQLLKSLATPGITITIPEPTYKDAIDQFKKCQPIGDFHSDFRRCRGCL